MVWVPSSSFSWLLSSPAAMSSVSTEFQQGGFGVSDVNVSDSVLVKFELLVDLRLLSGETVSARTIWKSLLCFGNVVLMDILPA